MGRQGECRRRGEGRRQKLQGRARDLRRCEPGPDQRQIDREADHRGQGAVPVRSLFVGDRERHGGDQRALQDPDHRSDGDRQQPVHPRLQVLLLPGGSGQYRPVAGRAVVAAGDAQARDHGNRRPGRSLPQQQCGGRQGEGRGARFQGRLYGEVPKGRARSIDCRHRREVGRARRGAGERLQPGLHPAGEGVA